LSERIDSSLQENEFVFDPYDADQLQAILDNRTDAFESDVLEPDVIPKVAALSAKEHGGARKAIDTLYEAGRLAEKQGTETVTVSHVDDAVQRAEIKKPGNSGLDDETIDFAVCSLCWNSLVMRCVCEPRVWSGCRPN
jgi:cell division control protein 6